jgi:hypothetical protein
MGSSSRVLSGALVRRIIPKERDWPERLTVHRNYFAFEEGETEMEEVKKEETKDVYLPTVGTVEVTASPGWTNWRTLMWGMAVAVVPAMWNWFNTVPWDQYLSPTWAMIFVGAVTMAFRFVSNGPAMSNVTVKKM